MDAIRDRRDIVFDEFVKFYKSMNIKGVKNILDIGCYNDYYKDKFASINLNWIGMDKNPTPGVFLKGNMENLPMNDSTFDIIFSNHSFEHTIDPIRTLNEFKRVLKISGILYLVVPYPCESQIYSMDKTHYFVLSEMQLLNLLFKCGYTILKNDLVKITEDEKEWQIIIAAGVM